MFYNERNRSLQAVYENCRSSICQFLTLIGMLLRSIIQKKLWLFDLRYRKRNNYSAMSEITMNNLPSELIIKILRKVDKESLKNAVLTCKLYESCLHSPCFLVNHLNFF